jgi:hypothetical protein
MEDSFQDLSMQLSAAVDEITASMLPDAQFGGGWAAVDNPDAHHARIRFRGPIAGEVRLRCDPLAADSIARSLLMMGPSEPMSDEELRDALGEFTNLVSGAFKTRALDPRGTYTLSVPDWNPENPPAGGELHGTVGLAPAGGLARIEVWLDSASARQESPCA